MEEMYTLTQDSFSQEKKKKIMRLKQESNACPDYQSDEIPHRATDTQVGNGSLTYVLIDGTSGIYVLLTAGSVLINTTICTN